MYQYFTSKIWGGGYPPHIGANPCTTVTPTGGTKPKSESFTGTFSSISENANSVIEPSTSSSRIRSIAPTAVTQSDSTFTLCAIPFGTPEIRNPDPFGDTAKLSSSFDNWVCPSRN